MHRCHPIEPNHGVIDCYRHRFGDYREQEEFYYLFDQRTFPSRRVFIALVHSNNTYQLQPDDPGRTRSQHYYWDQRHACHHLRWYHLPTDQESGLQRQKMWWPTKVPLSPLLDQNRKQHSGMLDILSFCLPAIALSDVQLPSLTTEDKEIDASEYYVCHILSY